MKQNEIRYPALEIDLDQLQENLAALKGRCQFSSIGIAGVVKGFTALPEVVKTFDESGLAFIASSRIEQLKRCKENGIRTPLLLIRIPMLSELADVVRYSEASLESELTVLRALNEEAARQGKTHQVLLMVDLGDLREGFWDRAELAAAALEVERELDNLELVGIGTNLGCYGSVAATPEKMEELLDAARAVEEAIGRKLQWISGGSTSSVPMVLEGTMPAGINLLRLGESILQGNIWGYETDLLHRHVFTLKAEVVELKTKPSHPVGKLSYDSFGRQPVYEDRGDRCRALVAIGRVDYGEPGDLTPRMEGVEVLGASSDHTILDVEAVKDRIHVGDVLEFDLCYSNAVYLTNTESVHVYTKKK
ncbi:MAG: alanine/ornithine racemase family PLP-dependent enzyme [Clostridiales bacterium]|nr:alanine/ornithine racemase family PLP-dependent enzyme [Clostridiales bacterium]